MTEPRQPEAAPEDEATRPITQDDPRTDASGWYPVDQPPAERVEEVGAESSVDPAVVPSHEQGTEAWAEPNRPRTGPGEAAPDARVEAMADEPVGSERDRSGTGPGEPVRDPAEPVTGRVETTEDEPVRPDEATEIVDRGPDEPTAVVDRDLNEPTAVVDRDLNEPTAVVDRDPNEPTAVVDRDPNEPTAVVDRDPNGATAVVGALPGADPSRTERLRTEDDRVPPPGGPADGIFRPASPTSGPSPEPTRMEPLAEEERRLAAERAARREARTANLAATAPPPPAAPEPVVIHHRTNDKFWGALGLFLLRVVLAGIFAIRGLNILTDIPAAQAEFARTVIPEPGIMAIVTGVAAELIALSLLLGLLTRVAGLGVALIAAGALTFVYWGPWSPFVPGQPGFTGEYELLLATVGVLLLLVGGGGWSLDRSFRAGRERDRRDRAAAGL